MPTAVDDATSHRARFEEVFPSAVTITRTSDADFKSRQLIVWIDGARVATAHPMSATPPAAIHPAFAGPKPITAAG